MKTIFYCSWLLLVIAGCSDAGASSESVPVVINEEKHACEMKLSKPVYYVGEACQKADELMQGIQAVTHNGQLVRGVRCVKIEHSCKP